MADRNARSAAVSVACMLARSPERGQWFGTGRHERVSRVGTRGHTGSPPDWRHAESFVLEGPPGIPDRAHWIQGELAFVVAGRARRRRNRVGARSTNAAESVRAGTRCETLRSRRGDIRDFAQVKSALAECRPEVVIHMAAQSVVRRSYDDPIETYSSNVMGTVHVLEAYVS